jgi:hypothetical protein
MSRRALAAVGLVIVSFAVWVVNQPDHRVRDYAAAMRAAHEPLTLEAVVGRMPAASENAASGIKQAVKSVEATLGTSSQWPVDFGWGGREPPQLSAANRSSVEQFVRRLRPFREGVETALARPRCRFSDARSRSAHERMRTQEPLWQAMVLLRAVAWCGDDSNERLDACRVWARVIARLEPVSSSDDQFISDEMLACLVTIQREVGDGAWDVRRVRRHMDDVLAVPWLDRVKMQYVLCREGVVRQEVESLDADSEMGFAAKLDRRWRSLTGGQQSYDERNRRSTDEVLTIAEALREAATVPADPYPRHVAAVRAIIAARGAPRWIECIPSVDMYAQTETRCRLARIALAAAEHRATRGDFPASLDDLKWAFPDGIPLDPFTNAPFVYTRTDDGIRIASPGRLADEAPVDDATLRELFLVWEMKR